ncbi:MAG: hypothetical protein ACI9EW_003443 [Cellvibrionaceae bacterium]|jgi:hypothetical protein
MSVTTSTKQNRKFSLPKLLALAGILLTFAAPALKGWRVYRSANALQSRIESIQLLTNDGLNGLDTAALEEGLLELRIEALTLHGELEPLLPYTSWIAWTPRFGELTPVMPELLRLLDNGTAIAADLGVNVLPIIPILQDDSTPIETKLPDMLRVIDEADASLEQTALLWPTVYRDLETILNDPSAREALPWQVRQQIPTIEPLLPLVEKGIQALRILPEVGAIDGRRAYLIVGQNSDELRPTGGFLSMTMAVGLENGQVKGSKISDANIVDNYFEKPYGDPPAAMREFLGIDLFLFRDSNYWPDFPTSSRKMMDFYTYGTGIELDGVIAFDIRFISQLIGAIGPIEIPELGFTLTGDNTIEVLEQTWGDGLELENRFVTRKDFLGSIATELIKHIQSEQFNPDIATLATILDTSLRDKSLQLFVNSAEEEEVFSQMAINGAVVYKENEDFLLLAQNNVGYNKSNRMLETALEYNVQLHATGGGSASLKTKWFHAGSNGNEFCELSFFSYAPGLVYSDMIQECNWNHIRLYTPPNTRLIDSGIYPIEAEKMTSKIAWPGETRAITNDLAGFTVFENLRLLPAGESSEFDINYELDTVVQNNTAGEKVYRLNLIRQAGVYPYPETTVSVTLPDGSDLISTSIEPVQITGNRLTFSIELSENQLIEVIFQ